MPSIYLPFPFAPGDQFPAPSTNNSIYLRLIGKSAMPVVELRTTRVVLSGDGESTALPFMRCTSRRAASRPFSTIGWRTVVSGGVVQDEGGKSSEPTTENSSGTRLP